MKLETGATLGQYEILSSLGAGGMGEVYRARDTKLGREVAIKVLPEDVAQDAERLARFEREARVLASLNHPNIATLHGFEQEGDTDFLVMELVEGETLADRIARGPIPVDQVIPLFLQIAEGLDAAHQHAVIHRDLKPANIKVALDDSKGWRVKILDFGLAKGLVSDGDDAAQSGDSPTLTLAATQRGEILGTAGYMSPEQARGSAVDRRTDIWAFGACLFEALAGRRAFDGGSTVDVLAGVLKSDPDWEMLPSDVPAPLLRLLRHCLDKSRGSRLRDIGDAIFEMRSLLTGEDTAQSAFTGVRSVPVRNRWTLTVATILVSVGAGLVVGLFLGSRPDSVEQPVRRFGDRLRDGAGAVHSLALSPQGNLLATSLLMGNEWQILLRRLDVAGFHFLAGTENGEFPFFSPDGEWLAFFTRGHQNLVKVPIGGGAPVTLAESLERNWGGSWSEDGWIVYHSQSQGDGLLRVRDVGGEAQTLTKPDRDAGEQSHRWPQVLPGGKAVLFTIWKGSADVSEIGVVDIRDGGADGAVRILTPGTFGRYLTSGHLVYFDESRLMAVAVDPGAWRLAGKPAQVPGIESGGPWGYRHFSVSNGGLAAHTHRPTSRLVWADLQGRTQAIPLPPGSFSTPNLSADGERIAVALEEAGRRSDIWVLNADGSGPLRLTERGENESPVWTPDGEWVLFWSERDGMRAPYRRRADGTGEAERLTPGAHGRPVDVSPDGKWMTTSYLSEIWALPIGGAAEPRILVEAEFRAGVATVHPGGEWYSYTSTEFGLAAFRISRWGGGRGITVKGRGGQVGRWSPDGRELFYLYDDGNRRVMMKRDFEPATGAVGEETELFVYSGLSTTTMDWDTDGQRFLFAVEDEPPTVHFVENWFEELQRFVPTE